MNIHDIFLIGYGSYARIATSISALFELQKIARFKLGPDPLSRHPWTMTWRSIYKAMDFFLWQALREATRTDELGAVPIGAVTVRGDEIIARA